jgi:hypothetical protein
MLKDPSYMTRGPREGLKIGRRACKGIFTKKFSRKPVKSDSVAGENRNLLTV